MSYRQPLLRSVSLVLVSFLLAVNSTEAQDTASKPAIAVLRLKPVDIVLEKQRQCAELLPALNEALRGNGYFTVPSDDAIAETIDDEGISQDGLIDMDDLADAAEALKLDFYAIGSVTQKMLTFHTQIRVYDAKENVLRAVVSSDQAIEPAATISTYLTGTIENALKNPGGLDAHYDGFTWSQQVLLTFGSSRIDLEPPHVYFTNDNPPFEISAKVDMERLRSSFAVINISFFADGEHIGSIYPQLSVPRVLNEHEMVIGGHTFCFQLDVQELRTTNSGGIISAKVVFTCRHCPENE